MKKLVIISIFFFLSFLSGCYLFANDKSKLIENPSYIEDYMLELGLTDIEEIFVFAETEVMDLAYEMSGENEKCHSDYIYFYRGTDSEGVKYDVLIPERAKEPNLVFIDYLLSFEELAQIIQLYNDSTESTISTYFTDKSINTNDILLWEEDFRIETINDIWNDVDIGYTVVDVDEEAIRELLMENLSSPIIYQIGRYLNGDLNNFGTVYLGLGKDLEYVFILEYNHHTNIDIIYKVFIKK